MKKLGIASVLATALLACVWPAAGATNYWDNNGASAGFGAAGGTWGVDPLWGQDFTGASAPAVTVTTADDDLYFGLPGLGLESGTIALDGTNQAFRSIRFGLASGAVAITGGVLNAGAPLGKVTVYNASNTIASALAGPNGLQKYRPPTLIYTNFLMLTNVVVFTNATLVDYVAAGGIMQGSSIPNRTPAGAFFFTNKVTNATFQAQALDGVYTKCVKVELTQVGSDIAARPVYAKYLDGSRLGTDFDGNGTGSTIATNATTGGYGIVQTSLYAMPEVYEPFLTTAFSNILWNASLSNCVGLTAWMGGGSVGSTAEKLAPAAAYFFVNNGSNATVQIQSYNGGYTKCVKVELAQSGTNISARALYAKYHNSGNNVLGFDFDTGGTVGTVATSFTTGTYGVWELALNMAHTLTLGGACTYTGDTAIDWGRLEVGGAGQLGGGVYSGAVANAGQLVYNSTAGQTLCGNISGSGSLVKGSPGKTATNQTYNAFLALTPTVIFPGSSLADCIGADGQLGGSFVNGGSGLPFPADAYYFSNDGTNAAFQLQAYEGGHTKCVKVALAQSGADVTGYAVYAKYLLSTNALGINFDTNGVSQSIATSFASAGYGASQTVLTFFRHATLTLSGVNSYSSGTAVNAGRLAVVGNVNALPSGGGVTVNAGGELYLCVTGLIDTAGAVGGVNPVTVNPGGLLTLASRFNAGHTRPITINGGVLNSLYYENFDNGNYINKLTLMNGARVTGSKVRVGYVSAPTITVSGSSPSSLEAGLNLVRSGATPLTFSVADVTGSDAADLVVSGVIRDYVNFEGMPIVKAGAGTLSLAAANTHTGLVTVAAGTLALDANGALNTGITLALNGGTLAMGAATNTLGALAVLTNSAIALGAGRLSFADSSAAAWTNRLSLTGELGAQTLRFGTSRAALTAAQVSSIKLNGRAVRLKSDGYVTASWGTVIMLK